MCVCVCSQLIKKHGINLFTQNTNTSANANTHTWRRTLLIRRVACLIFSSIQSATFSEIFYFHSVLLFVFVFCPLLIAYHWLLCLLLFLFRFRFCIRLFILSTLPFSLIFILHFSFAIFAILGIPAASLLFPQCLWAFCIFILIFTPLAQNKRTVLCTVYCGLCVVYHLIFHFRKMQK